MGSGRSKSALAPGQSVGHHGVRHSRLRAVSQVHSSMSDQVTPLGRVVATERKPNTPHEFHFWTGLDSPVGIGTIVRVDGPQPVNGVIPRIYGTVIEGFSYTDLQSPLHDVMSADGSPGNARRSPTERVEIRLY